MGLLQHALFSIAKVNSCLSSVHDQPKTSYEWVMLVQPSSLHLQSLGQKGYFSFGTFTISEKLTFTVNGIKYTHIVVIATVHPQVQVEFVLCSP